MPPLPIPIPHTSAAIYKAYEARRSSYEAVGINVGDIAKACQRALWYDFRRASPGEIIEGRKLRIFATGNIEEERLLADLEAIGCTVANQQARVKFCGGHVRGAIDGEVTGVPEAPVTTHIVECKSSNEKGFKALTKDGLEKAKPLHYGQCQLYMHGRNLTRALYLCVNKDDDSIYVERVRYDVAYCLRMLARAEHVIRADDPPAKLHEDPTHKMAFECGYCRNLNVCHKGAWARRGCRTCIHATAVLTSDNACWDCSRWSKPLSLAEQAAGCDRHRYLPGLVPGGKQIDVDMDAETVTYEMPNGEIWIDGAGDESGAKTKVG